MDRDDDPCKLFVGGLTRSTTTEMLHQYFQTFGELTDCIVIKNPTTKLSRCFGFVQFTTPEIADHVVESRPHIIDGKEIDVKHASAESHERHQQQLAAAAAAGAAAAAAAAVVGAHERNRETSPDRQKKRSRWEKQQQQLLDSHRNYTLPHDMITLKSNTHIAFIQRDLITYPVPLKYLREDNVQQQYNSPPSDNSYYPQQTRQQHNNNFNIRMYPT
ncbi:unnamed protein product [Rotaria sp. Silwood2]|nr:unnamed protein product [Rotaria sp. Silwood2]CAF2814092.1 unnamed protein product [Rotaria sp. Silwood2]CAF3981044.1 unnamed protein product [Rotaria sp. Silwood2]CAF4252768.1 unnamed protein product [Rotaria sp. Silwood2]